MEAVIETYAEALGLNTLAASYANLDQGKQQSVANFVLDRKGSGYEYESVLRSVFNAGVTYENAKVTFSTALKSQTPIVSANVQTLKDAYLAVATFDGQTSPTITTNVAILDKVIGLDNAANLAKLNEFANLNGSSSPAKPSYTINVDSLTTFLAEFNLYLDYEPQGQG